MTLQWWGKRLVAEVKTYPLRLEIVADGDKPIDQLADKVKNGPDWSVHGRLLKLRANEHQARLLAGLGDAFGLKDGELRGPEVRVPDPFAFLPQVLEAKRPNRLTALVHGDLNPRNILVVGDETPCLIDYAFMRKGEPFFLDFGRLEGSLTRDVLPADFTWRQLVRLERLLGLACRLGDDASQKLAEVLTAERAELGAAFRLFWAIRRAARAVCPESYRAQWARDYLEQLFLFAHLTLKWDDAEASASAKLRATAALAGVAAEVLASMAPAATDGYALWDDETLRQAGAIGLPLLATQREATLAELAQWAFVLQQRNLKATDPLWQAFEGARADFVRQHFAAAANATLTQLQDEHDIYISLRAYIDLKGQVSAGRERSEAVFSTEDLFEK